MSNSAYPGALDSFTDPTASSNLSDAGVVHHSQHGVANDALAALETKVGRSAGTPVDAPMASGVLSATSSAQTAWAQLAYNVKAYGAKGDGSTDDTAAITAAINDANTAGGGLVFFPPGTYITTLQTIYTAVHLWGAGIEATILKLKASSNSALLRSNSFATLTGGDTAGGIHDFSIRYMSIDGNKGSQTGTSPVIQLYGFGFVLDGLRVRNGIGDGLYSEWSHLSDPLTPNSMEAIVRDCKFHDNSLNGFHWKGPHDSLISDCFCYRNLADGFLIEDATTFSSGGNIFTRCHSYGSAGAIQVNAWHLASNTQMLEACSGEGGSNCQILLDASNCVIMGGRYFGAGAIVPVGIKIGVAASGRFQVNNLIYTAVDDCAAGAVQFNQDGGASETHLLISNSAANPTIYQGTAGAQHKIDWQWLGTSSGGWVRDPNQFALTPAGTVTIDPTSGNHFTLTPSGATTINTEFSAGQTGQFMTLVLTTSGTLSFTITFGTQFKSQGTLATGTVSGKVFTLYFYCDGNNFNEISRTVAM